MEDCFFLSTANRMRIQHSITTFICAQKLLVLLLLPQPTAYDQLKMHLEICILVLFSVSYAMHLLFNVWSYTHLDAVSSNRSCNQWVKSKQSCAKYLAGYSRSTAIIPKIELTQWLWFYVATINNMLLVQGADFSNGLAFDCCFNLLFQNFAKFLQIWRRFEWLFWHWNICAILIGKDSQNFKKIQFELSLYTIFSKIPIETLWFIDQIQKFHSLWFYWRWGKKPFFQKNITRIYAVSTEKIN